ncbi:hypothetical protein PANT_24d00018 [Moesziomyces antarcticus T-34]|uniref:PITH domain-containing protein n=1 Tax=Pseudozyma antarctica (strain T-34) TaxID=1151754 RepID=M9MIK0_PSEA3|nr:hypothetical protein PANT_24d00018 [Moesziomyces antarcticus T-34]
MSCNTANEDRDNRDPAPAAAASSGLSAVDGDATSLYEYINRDKVWGANLDPPESAKHVIKPWDQRLTAEPSTQSNVDDQIAITVPFTCPVRLKSILINTGTGDFAPTRCRAFVNRPDGVDFDDVDDATSQDHPAQLSPLAAAATLGSVASGKAQADFALLRGQDGVVEYPVSVARFSHTTSITIVLSHSNATTLSRFFYLGFRGTALVLKSEPGERLNIGAANAADRPVDGVREKRGASQGLAGGSGRSPRYVVDSPRAAERIARMAEGSASPNSSSQGTPRRSPRRNKDAQHADSPSTTPTRKRTRQSSVATDADDDSTTASSASAADASTSSLGSRARDRARDSMASGSTRSNRSSLASRATMLVPGESVPGDLTRDSNVSDSLEVDESMASIGSPDELSRSRLSDIGIPRRTSGMGMVRGGIFAAMAERPKQSRVSTGSRVSFADQLSPASMRFDDMSSRREDELERSLHPSRGADSFVSASGIDLATQRAIARLDDLTRRSFFSDDGGLHLDEDDYDTSADADARRRRSGGRSMSEPLEGEADGSIVVFDNVDDGYGMDVEIEEDEVSDSLAIEGEDDSDGEVRRLEDGSLSREAIQHGDASGSGDDSRVSRVSFAEQDEVSFQVDDAYSDDDDVQYGLSSMQEELEEEDEEEGDERDASARRLDLLDAKDLNALLKRRIVKKRRARKSPHTGNAVPPLPASIMRDMFASFLTPAASSSASLLSSSGSAPAKKAKLDATVLDELDAAAHDFFADFAANLMQQAKARTSRRAGEGMSINEADVVGVLKRQGRVTQRHDASSLAHRLMPRELTDQMELSRWAKTGTVQTTLGFSSKKKKARADKSMADTTAASSVVLEDETM